MKKNSKNEPSLHAFTRMNFLYQASCLISKDSNKTALANYYGKLVKDISKKTLEKVHPDVKRTLCKACNHPLVTQCESSNVKVKPCRKKKSKKSSSQKNDRKKIKRTRKPDKMDNVPVLNYQKTRIDARIKRPNKILYICNCCGFSKPTLQRPNHQVWINQEEALKF